MMDVNEWASEGDSQQAKMRNFPQFISTQTSNYVKQAESVGGRKRCGMHVWEFSDNQG